MEYVLNNTYGVLVYQEQILEIVRKFGVEVMVGQIYFKAVGGKRQRATKTETEN